jgi:hypothetical protein
MSLGPVMVRLSGRDLGPIGGVVGDLLVAWDKR